MDRSLTLRGFLELFYKEFVVSLSAESQIVFGVWEQGHWAGLADQDVLADLKIVRTRLEAD